MRHPLFNLLGYALYWVLVFSVLGCRDEWGVNPDEFANLDGVDARDYLKQAWPEGVDANEVESVSLKSQSSRDSYSSWYRIKLTQAAALKWANKEHDDEVAWCRSRADGHTAPEGVKRIIAGPPPLDRPTGTTPTWWNPPEVDFQATEVMLWYADGGSGVARATYTGFDVSEKTLWIYKYAAQHKRLWERGELPDGDPIDFTPKQ